MKCTPSVIPIFMYIFSVACAAAGAIEIQAYQDLSVITYSVTGSTQQSSLPEEATRFLNEGKFLFSQQNSLLNGDMYGNLNYRATDDTTIDPRSFTITGLSMGFRRGMTDIMAGDCYGFFSDLTLNNALKGAKVEIGTPGAFQVILTGGANSSTWEELWEEKTAESLQSAWVYGARAQAPLFDNTLLCGLNYAASIDDRSYFNESNTYKDRSVASADVTYRPADSLSIKSEYAQSERRVYIDADGAYAPKGDSACKVGIQFAQQILSFGCDYSRIGPAFETTGGFAAQDLESLQCVSSVSPLSFLTLSGYLNLSRDDLENQKETRSNRENPGLGILVRLPYALTLTGGWDSNKEYTDNLTSHNRTDTYNAGLSGRLSSNSASLQYSRAHTDNYIDLTQQTTRTTLSFNASGDFLLWHRRFGWSIGEQVDKMHNDYADTQDVLLMHSGGISGELPGGIRVDARVNAFDCDYYDVGNDSTRYSCDLSASKELTQWLSASAAYFQGDNYFSDGRNNYFEKKLMGKVSCRF